MEAFSDDMKKVPVLRALLPLTAGLLLYPALALSTESLIWIILFVISLFLYVLTLKKRRPVIPSLCLFALLMLVGLLLSLIRDRQDQFMISEGQAFIKGEVIGLPSTKPNSISFPFEVHFMKMRDIQNSTKMKVMVYMNNDSTYSEVRPGEQWIFYGNLNQIRNNGNPGEFDYQSYMKRKGFQYVFFVHEEHSKQVSFEGTTKLKYLPLKARNRVSSRWDPNNVDHQVLKALTLGDKRNLDIETRASFSTAGAMHLLAVSGLHIGMIWMILDKLFSVFARTRPLKVFKTVLIISILWFYAAITGFSESVTRSVCMFSLVSLSSGIGRKSNIFNTLFLSAFILLILNPDRLYDTGFQLSYVAVFGIVTIQPLIENWICPGNKLLKYLFDLISVSIAATIITLPLTLLYFHQFSVYFILSNIVAIPIVSLILLVFVLVSPVLLSTGAPGILDIVLSKLAHVLNASIACISNFPYARISDIPMIKPVALLLLLLIMFLLAFFYYRKFIFLFGGMIMATCIFTISGLYWAAQQGRSEIRIYNQRKSMLLSIREGARESVYFLPVDSLDYYTEEYLSTFKQKPKKHFEAEYIDLGLSCHLLSEGLWAIFHHDLKILVIGKCKAGLLMQFLMKSEWDLIIFTSGFPRYTELFNRLGKSAIFVGDGTLTFSETLFLKNKLHTLFLVKEKGSFTYSEIWQGE